MSTMRARYTEQMPWVGTPTQKAKIMDEAERDGVSQAEIVRKAVDIRYGLVNGEEVSDETVDSIRTLRERVEEDTLPAF